MSDSKRPSPRGSWLLVLFALPFAGVGVFMTGLIFNQLSTARAMRAWIEAPAIIREAELSSHRGRKGSTTYRVEVRYDYAYGGRAYSGTRVSLHGASDNIGSFQQDAYREVARYRDGGKPFRCFVNPAHPEEAVLYRTVRTEMILFEAMFAVLFGGAGFGMLIGGLYARSNLRRRAALASDNPDAPWRWREDWAAGVIRSGNRALAWFYTAFAAFWNVFVYGFVGVNARQLLAKPGMIWFVLVFAAVGLFLAGLAARAHVLARRYGAAVFRMASVPGVLGGRLAGAVQMPGDVRPPDGLRVQLQCVETTGSGKHRQVRVLWSDERQLASESLPADEQGTVVPVLFAIPYDQPHSRADSSERDVKWRLNVVGRQTGVDVEVDFDVPVFRTAESRPDFQLDEKPVEPYLARLPVDRLVEAERVTMELQGAAVVFTFPAARRPGQAVAVTLFAALFGVASVWLWHQAPVVFSIFSAVFSALCAYGALDAWLGTARIEADPEGVRWRKGFLGGGAARAVSKDDIVDICAEVGSQNNQRIQYRLRLVEQGGRRRTLGRDFVEKSAADAVARELKRALGLVKSP